MFDTVFDITRDSGAFSHELAFRMLIGIAAVAIAAFALVRGVRRAEGRAGNLLRGAALLAWGVAWLVLHQFPFGYGNLGGLREAARDGTCATVEGEVKVLRAQPYQGHSAGDRIEIGGEPFEVNYYLATPAYHDTVAHGGVLRDGAYARVCHVDGALVRVAIRR